MIAGVLVLAIVERPVPAAAGTRVLDAALLAALAGMAIQLVPLTPATRAQVAPAAAAFDLALRVRPAVASARPMSVHPDATRSALLLAAACVTAFFTARSVLGRGGRRILARGVAGLGLVLAPLTIVQHATSPGLFYWTWPAYAENALPYGPFVNRNDLATWLVMAIPLTVGSLIARFESRRPPRPRAASITSADATSVWLVGAAALMTAALVATVSRSGLAGAAVASCVLAVSAARRSSWRVGVVWMAAAGAAATIAALTYANAGELASRLDAAVSEGMAGRLSIWRQTWPMARAFWPIGTGVGAFENAMILYQTGSRLFYVNHAHSEYLQILTEGGALVGLPAAVAVLAAIWQTCRRVAEDRTPMYWLRAGSAAGMAGVLVQSIWETTLRMPANSLLLALVAAVALHPVERTDEAG